MTSDTPPHSIESESAVISLILAGFADRDIMSEIDPILRAECFYSTAHQEIYRAAATAYRKKQKPDAITVAEALKTAGKLERAGGMEYLMEVIHKTPNTANVQAYARVVRDKHNLRQLIKACGDIKSEAFSPHGEDNEFIHKAGLRLRDVTRVADKASIRSNSDALRVIFKRIQDNALLKTGITGLHTGIAAYDRKTTGLHGGRLTILGARPGTGKSSRLLQIANHIATLGIGVHFFSLEMTQEENLQRLIAARAEVDATKIETGTLTPEQWTKVTFQTGEIDKLPLNIDESPDLTIDNIRERALGAIEDGYNKNKPIGLIIVDYLQRIKVRPDDRKKSRVEVVADMARGLKELAKETKLPVVSAAALKRLPEGRPGRRPTMDDLRECGDIENEADDICLIHRPAMYDHKSEESDAEFIIDKARHGTTGTVRVRWHPEFVRFEDLPENVNEW